MAASPAWLLRFEGGHRAALGPLEVVHVLTGDTPRFAVPGTPATSRQVVLWQDRPLPVMDLSAWVDGHASTGAPVVGVVAYAGPTGVEHGALLLDGLPRQVQVDDGQALAPEDLPSRWAAIAHSAYRDAEGPVPVLDLARLFSRVWPPPAS